MVDIRFSYLHIWSVAHCSWIQNAIYETSKSFGLIAAVRHYWPSRCHFILDRSAISRFV